jgi:hypothetical protein
MWLAATVRWILCSAFVPRKDVTPNTIAEAHRFITKNANILVHQLKMSVIPEGTRCAGIYALLVTCFINGAATSANATKDLLLVASMFWVSTSEIEKATRIAFCLECQCDNCPKWKPKQTFYLEYFLREFLYQDQPMNEDRKRAYVRWKIHLTVQSVKHVSNGCLNLFENFQVWKSFMKKRLLLRTNRH